MTHQPPPSEIATILAAGRARFDAAWAAFEKMRHVLVDDPGLVGKWVVFDGQVRHADANKRAAHRWGMMHLGPSAGFIVARVEVRHPVRISVTPPNEASR